LRSLDLLMANLLSGGAKSIDKKYHTYMVEGKIIVVLYYRPRNIYVLGKVVTMIDSEVLAEHLWGRDTDGRTWRYVYFIEPIAIVYEHDTTSRG